MDTLLQHLNQVFAASPVKLTVSKPRPASPYRRVTAERKEEVWQFSKYTETQVFHENISPEEAPAFCAALLSGQFGQLNAWTGGREYTLLLSKKGTATLRSAQSARRVTHTVTHDRQKNYLLPEGEVVPALVDMGVFTREGRIVRTMYDKYRQINRFLELIDDELKKRPEKTLNVIDFGCGKSYLTFVVYHYLTRVRGLEVNMIGLDLKEDVIARCAETAEKYGYTGLRFCLGDINGFRCPFDVDMVITLHACDTATDFALYNAVQWGAKLIFSVPCCQHEVNSQISSEELSLLTRYGIVKERFSALLTDALRANLLEYAGYRTQLLEFIDLEHTPKNILIRASLAPRMPADRREKALEEARRAIDSFHLSPTLYTLLTH